VRAALCLHPIERSLLLSTRGKSLSAIATMTWPMCANSCCLFVGDSIFSAGRDVIEIIPPSHVVLRALSCRLPQGTQSNVHHRPRIHALGRQRPHHARFSADSILMLHQRFRYWNRARHIFGEHLVRSAIPWCLLIALMFPPFMNFFLQFFSGGRVAHVLRKSSFNSGNFFVLMPKHFYG